MDWMYKEHDISQEDYLQGRRIDKNFGQQGSLTRTVTHRDNDRIVVTKDIQVDMTRKLMEDPLVTIRKKQIEKQREILSNPARLKHMRGMVMKKEQVSPMKKAKKSSKKLNMLTCRILRKLKSLKHRVNIPKLHKLIMSKKSTGQKIDITEFKLFCTKRKKNKKLEGKERKHDAGKRRYEVKQNERQRKFLNSDRDCSTDYLHRKRKMLIAADEVSFKKHKHISEETHFEDKTNRHSLDRYYKKREYSPRYVELSNKSIRNVEKSDYYENRDDRKMSNKRKYSERYYKSYDDSREKGVYHEQRYTDIYVDKHIDKSRTFHRNDHSSSHSNKDNIDSYHSVPGMREGYHRDERLYKHKKGEYSEEEQLSKNVRENSYDQTHSTRYTMPKEEYSYMPQEREHHRSEKTMLDLYDRHSTKHISHKRRYSNSLDDRQHTSHNMNNRGGYYTSGKSDYVSHMQDNFITDRKEKQKIRNKIIPYTSKEEKRFVNKDILFEETHLIKEKGNKHEREMKQVKDRQRGEKCKKERDTKQKRDVHEYTLDVDNHEIPHFSHKKVVIEDEGGKKYGLKVTVKGNDNHKETIVEKKQKKHLQKKTAQKPNSTLKHKPSKDNEHNKKRASEKPDRKTGTVTKSESKQKIKKKVKHKVSKREQSTKETKAKVVKKKAKATKLGKKKKSNKETKDKNLKAPKQLPSVTEVSNPWKEEMEEKEQKRKEMIENAKRRVRDRLKNLQFFAELEKKEDEKDTKPYDEDFSRKQLSYAMAEESVEQRIRSNIHNIQKSSVAMDSSFVKR